jgi:CRP-like cAMP-binding protein
MFGETSKFSGYDLWPATIIAQEDSTVMFIKAERFMGNCQNVCNSHKRLIMNMLEILAKKALMLNRKVEYLTIKSLRGKVAAFILENYKKNSQLTFNLPMNRADVADFLNVSRPALSREMGRMQEEGIIDFYKATIKILNLESLEKCLEY